MVYLVITPHNLYQVYFHPYIAIIEEITAQPPVEQEEFELFRSNYLFMMSEDAFKQWGKSEYEFEEQVEI